MRQHHRDTQKLHAKKHHLKSANAFSKTNNFISLSLSFFYFIIIFNGFFTLEHAELVVLHRAHFPHVSSSVLILQQKL